jgi:uncharacterized ParB-like nuclease family protein
MTTNVIEIKNAKEAPRSERSSMETLIISTDMVSTWQLPPFQRPKRINAKVQAMAEEIKQSACAIQGVITLGKLGKAGALYIVDGQHRLEAFKMSGLEEVIADVRIVHFTSMAEMADEFVLLNSALVKMRPDDVLRGMEPSSKGMQRIRSECAYVAYDNVRRGDKNSPVVSMGLLLRSWGGSAMDTPVAYVSGRTAAQLGLELDDATTDDMIRFLHLAFQAWGREPQYYRLWSALNLTMCMWLYRRLVLDRTRGVKRFVVLTDSQFRQCLMALSADDTYVDWLQGRRLDERDRSPCYSHMRRIFAKRLIAEGNPKPLLPAPAWSTSGRNT